MTLLTLGIDPGLAPQVPDAVDAVLFGFVAVARAEIDVR